MRVCAPGGRVVTTAWADEGMFARSLDVIAEELPEIREPDRPRPSDWAEPDAVLGFVRGLGVGVDVDLRTAWFGFPSLEAAFALLEQASGPYLRMRAAIDGRDPAGWSRVRIATLEAWTELSRPAVDGGVELPAVYGVATLRAAPAG